MLSVAPNIVFAPNITQNAITGRKTQTLLISALKNIDIIFQSFRDATGSIRELVLDSSSR